MLAALVQRAPAAQLVFEILTRGSGGTAEKSPSVPTVGGNAVAAYDPARLDKQHTLSAGGKRERRGAPRNRRAVNNISVNCIVHKEHTPLSVIRQALPAGLVEFVEFISCIV